MTPTSDRRAAERAWRAFVEGDGSTSAPAVRDDVAASWIRSAAQVPLGLEHAPVVDEAPARWRSGAVARAFAAIEEPLRRVALDGDLVAAVTDADGAIVWMAGGRTMTRRAEQVAFVPGARWDEAAVGTNALALALRQARPATVFSAEHYAPMVHEWVCYSAPVRDPRTGRALGVIDLSTTWRRANPLALSTVTALARVVELSLGAGIDRPEPARASPDLELRVLGREEVTVRGRGAPLPLRQIELLAILALHPEGLTLDQLHDRLHGDRPVAPGSTRVDLSHLRRAVPDLLRSRPYRLEGRVDADLVGALDALRAGRVTEALDRYRGPVLVRSAAPELEEVRQLIDVALRDAVLGTGDADLLVRLSESLPHDPFVQERALAALAPADPRRALVRARLRLL